MLEELLQAWNQQSDFPKPPNEPIMLVQSGSVTVYIENSWGPPVPYPSCIRENGGTNYGFIRTKGDPNAIASIPEIENWPEYRVLLERINAVDTPIESVGCEKCFFPCSKGDANVQLGSYTDLIFCDLPMNDDPLNFLKLSAAIAPAMKDSKMWWSTAEFGIQRAKGIPSCTQPWSFMLRISGHGRDEDEARRSWNESVDRVGQLIAMLPHGFPHHLSSESD